MPLATFIGIPVVCTVTLNMLAAWAIESDERLYRMTTVGGDVVRLALPEMYIV